MIKNVGLVLNNTSRKLCFRQGNENNKINNIYITKVVIPTQYHPHQHHGPQNLLQYLARLSLLQLPEDQARMRQPQINNPTHTVSLG